MLDPRIMYIENKSAQPPGQKGVHGPARIGRVSFSKTGKSLYYRGKAFRSLKGSGISGPKRNGADGLYGPRPTPIDDDVREEYWTLIRKRPAKKSQKVT